MSRLGDKVDFNRIRYANCWEDADVLLSALQLQAGSRILCIASGGDNSLALLSTSPQSLMAVDLSGPQLYLTALKAMSFRHLSYQELLVFLGVSAAREGERKRYFDRISSSLTDDAREYWLNNYQVIERGIIQQGKFEQYFRFFRKWLLPLVHKKRTVDALLRPKSDAEQQVFYDKKWNTYRWKMMMHIFFSRYVMGRYGRDPEFLKQVRINVPDYIRRKAEAHLKSGSATRNYFLHYILKGRFGNGLPFYLRPENFEAIRSNIDKLRLVSCDVNTAMAEDKFDVCCLSNVFEYYPDALFEKTVQDWSVVLQAGTRLAFWNLMVPRSFSDRSPAAFQQLPLNTPMDNGFFYSKFLVEEKI